MKEQLQIAWQIHNSHNYLLLSELTPSDLVLCIARGRSVADQLSHIHGVRVNWLEHVGKSLFTKELLIPKDAVLTKDLLSSYLRASEEKIVLLINQSWEAGGKLPSFKSGLIPFITYLIAHESHHRGLILQILKNNGVKLPTSLKFGIWEWGKVPA